MAFTLENVNFDDMGTSKKNIAPDDRQCKAWTQKPGNPRCLNNKVVDKVKPLAQKTHADRIADELCGVHKKNISKFIVSYSLVAYASWHDWSSTYRKKLPSILQTLLAPPKHTRLDLRLPFVIPLWALRSFRLVSRSRAILSWGFARKTFPLKAWQILLAPPILAPHIQSDLLLPFMVLRQAPCSFCPALRTRTLLLKDLA